VTSFVGSGPSSSLITLVGNVQPLDGRVRLVTQECTESLHSPDFDAVDTTEQATAAKLTIRKQLRMANRDGESNNISNGLISDGQTTNLTASGRLQIAVKSCSPAWSSAFTTRWLSHPYHSPRRPSKSVSRYSEPPSPALGHLDIACSLPLTSQTPQSHQPMS
jgi:hypothetical protein